MCPAVSSACVAGATKEIDSPGPFDGAAGVLVQDPPVQRIQAQHPAGFVQPGLLGLQIGQSPAREVAGVGGNGAAGGQRQVEASQGTFLNPAEKHITLILPQHFVTGLGMIAQIGSKRLQRHFLSGERPFVDEDLADAPVGASVGAGIADPQETFSRQLDHPGTLHVKEKGIHRILQPNQLAAVLVELSPAINFRSGVIGHHLLVLERAPPDARWESGEDRRRPAQWSRGQEAGRREGWQTQRPVAVGLQQSVHNIPSPEKIGGSFAP